MVKGAWCAMPKIWAVITLVVGILYLGQDLGWWAFWTLSWWTVAFLMIAVSNLQGTLK
ncbi:hypothetical protein KY313_00940 [Candidatus Woesearchaeota archaeon]|jgi:hypothetical protein|nr:hypothetical protein [Candidatus Woesearchaeota archaeon]